MITYKMQFDSTPEQETLFVKIGKMSEIHPSTKKCRHDKTFGFTIETLGGHSIGTSRYGIDDFRKAQAEAALTAIAYVNGGFPLDYLLK